MSRIVRAAVAQAYGNTTKDEAIERQVALVEQAAAAGADVIGLQELCNGPYFCAEQDPKWLDWAEPDDGHTVTTMRDAARRLGVVIVVPFYEAASKGVNFNTAVVVERDGSLVGKYRKTHIPQVGPCFWEKYYFAPGDLGYPVFDTSIGKIGISICYDRHFPEVGRALGMNGAELVFYPSATTDYSRHLWEVEQLAQAVANGYFAASINRVGVEAPLCQENFYGSSYIADPRGQILAMADDQEGFVTADLDMSMLEEWKRTWHFFRDRRPETYNTGLTPRLIRALEPMP